MLISLLFGLILIVLAVSGQDCPTNKAKIICYYSSWSIYRKELGQFKIEYIDPTLCTHIVYAFAGLNLAGTIDSLDYANDINVNKAYIKINELKDENPCLKVLIAIGGWNEKSEKYSLLAESEESREKFADSALKFLAHYNFDGLDFDWEYPAMRGGIPEDKQNFVLLLEVIKAKFEKRGKLLTAAVAAPSKNVAISYDLKKICNVLDFISIMAYDMHLEDRTSVHAAFKPEMRQGNMESLVDIVANFKSSGCPLDKVILGVPAYGRTYTLQNPNKHDVGAPVKGWGEAGPFTQVQGFLGFNEICDKLYFGSWQTVYLKQNAVKYSFRDNQWMVYDDQETLTIKANYAKANKLGGMMMWSIDTDDFRGGCYNQPYPLLFAINKVFGFPAGGGGKK